jgi:3-oxoacyl-[acyl-carrier protein] reductase
VVVNDLFEARAKATVEQIAAQGGNAMAVAFDVTDAEAVAAGIAQAEEALGPVDILVNNAGVPVEMDVAPFRELSPALWKKYVDLNLYAVLHCSKAVVDGMVERGWGRIVTISSSAGQTGIGIGVALYGAGKAGAIGFTRHLAVELAGTGVTANCVALGRMNNAGDSDLARMLASRVPVGRLGTPEDVGAAVVYLASEEASWVTGQTLGVNGGSYTP